MELLQTMQSRRSIRKFKPDPVPDESIDQLLAAASLAPSGSNLQPARYLVVKSEAGRAKLAECTPLPFVAKAPVVFICCADMSAISASGQRFKELKEAGAFMETPLDTVSPADYSNRRPGMDEAAVKAYLNLNVAIAIDHITLRAVDLGLGSCWIMMFDQEKVRKTFGIGEQYLITALLPIGYPDQDPGPRPRLGLDEIVLKEE
ncbi:MAG TPA: nitroreductase family protein [Bacillota bacterium]|nr:nitroreductase family protein [Bacillota bacterium]